MENNTQSTKLTVRSMWQWPAVILGLALLAMPAVPGRAADANTPSAEPANRVAKAWAFDDPQNAWSASGGTTAKPADGCLKLHNAGKEGYVECPQFAVDVSNNTVRLSVKLKTTSATHGTFTWRLDAWTADFSPLTSAEFAITPDGSWHEYTVDAPMMGGLIGLRLATGTVEGDCDLAAVKVLLTPLAQPAIPVSLQGVLLDAQNQPVNEGFLMLKGNPQLNAVSGVDGRFRIEGNAWAMPDVLLASCAGCETTITPIHTSQMKALSINIKPQDPAFTKLEMGLSLKQHWPYMYEDRKRKLSADQQACIQAYDDFLKAKGEAILAKMLAGTPLADDERRYECILAAQIYDRTQLNGGMDLMSKVNDASAEIRYCARLIHAFYRISFKAVRRERLSAEELHTLRLWTANIGATGANPTAPNTDFCGPLRKFGLCLPPNPAVGPDLEPGARLPFDVPFMRTTPLFKSKGWTNYTTLSAGDYLRLEGLWPCLDFYAKWQVRDGLLMQSPPEEWKKRYWQDDYQVTSVNELLKQAKGKPLILPCINFEDTTGFGFAVRQAEHFRRAYRDTAEVDYTSQATDTAWTDIFVDEWVHYGPNPKANPLAGLDCARWEARTYTPFRQARMDKLCLMSHLPFASGEILQDLTRMTSYLGNRVADSFDAMFDRDGKVAEPFPGPSVTLYMALQNRAYANVPVSYTHPRRGGDNYWRWVIYEQLVRALIANNGRCTSDGLLEPNIFDRVLLQYPRILNSEHDIFVVTSVDKARQVIHASWIDPGGLKARSYKMNGLANPAWNGTPKGDFLLKVSPETRYVVRCKNGQPAWEICEAQEDPLGATFKLVGLDDIKPGDRFFATIRYPEPLNPDMPMATFMKRMPDWGTTKEQMEVERRPAAFDMAVYEGKELRVERLENYTQLNTYGAGMDFKLMPLYVKVIKKDKNVITVKFNKEDVTTMWGCQFWKEEEAKGRPADQTEQHFYPVYKRWADGTDEDRTYRFKIDGATEVYRNGLNAEAGELAEGDYVFVEYEMWWEKQKQQKEIIPPERVQASDPKIAPYEAPLARVLRKQGMTGTAEAIIQQVAAPTAEMLPRLEKAMADPDPVARKEILNGMTILVSKKVVEPAAACDALERAIVANKIPVDEAYAYRRKFTGSAAFVKNWLLLGVFPDPELKNFDVDMGPEKDGVDLAKTYPCVGGDAKWTSYASPFEHVPCGLGLQAPAGDSLAYAACWAKVDRDQTVAVEMGLSDTCKLWINRVPVICNNNVKLPGMVAETSKAFVHLKAGWNEILIKTVSAGGGQYWGFALQFYGMDGKTLVAEYAIQPPK